MVKKGEELGFGFTNKTRPQPNKQGRIATTLEWARRLTADDLCVLANPAAYSDKLPDPDEGFSVADVKNEARREAVFKIIQRRLDRSYSQSPEWVPAKVGPGGGRGAVEGIDRPSARGPVPHQVSQGVQPGRNQRGSGPRTGPGRRLGRHLRVHGVSSRLAAVTFDTHHKGTKDTKEDNRRREKRERFTDSPAFFPGFFSCLPLCPLCLCGENSSRSMPITSVVSFVEVLRQSRVLEPEQLSEVGACKAAYPIRVPWPAS